MARRQRITVDLLPNRATLLTEIEGALPSLMAGDNFWLHVRHPSSSHEILYLWDLLAFEHTARAQRFKTTDNVYDIPVVLVSLKWQRFVLERVDKFRLRG